MARVSGPQSSGTGVPAFVALATVEAVHPDRRTIDLQVDFGNKTLPDIPYDSGYSNSVTGTFFDSVPEEGAECYVCTPSDGTRPFIMSWSTPPKEGSFDEEEEPIQNHLGRKLGLQAGDIGLYNRRGAFMIMRKGGVLQVGASPIGQTMYIPVENMIRQYFQSYEAVSILGEMKWKHGEIKTEGDKTAVLLYWSSKNFVEDDYNAITIRIGRAGQAEFDPKQNELFGALHAKPWKYRLATTYPSKSAEETTFLSICVNPLNTGFTYTFQLDTEGNEFKKISGSLHWEGESAYLFLQNGFTVEFGATGKIVGTAANGLEAYVQSITAKAISKILIKAGGSCTLDGALIKLGGDSANYRAVLGEALLTYLATHRHMDPAGLVPFTGQPVIPPTTGILSKKVRLK